MVMIIIFNYHDNMIDNHFQQGFIKHKKMLPSDGRKQGRFEEVVVHFYYKHLSPFGHDVIITNLVLLIVIIYSYGQTVFALQLKFCFQPILHKHHSV